MIFNPVITRYFIWHQNRASERQLRRITSSGNQGINTWPVTGSQSS